MAFKMSTSAWIVLGLGGVAAYLVVKGASASTSSITSNTGALPSPTPYTPTYSPTPTPKTTTPTTTTTPTQTPATPQTDAQAATDWFSNLGGDGTPLPGGGN